MKLMLLTLVAKKLSAAAHHCPWPTAIQAKAQMRSSGPAVIRISKMLRSVSGVR